MVLNARRFLRLILEPLHCRGQQARNKYAQRVCEWPAYYFQYPLTECGRYFNMIHLAISHRREAVCGASCV